MPQNAGVQSRATSLGDAAPASFPLQPTAPAESYQDYLALVDKVMEQQEGPAEAAAAAVSLAKSVPAPSTSSSSSQAFSVPSIKEEIVDGDDMGDFGHAVFLGPEDGAGGGGLEEEGLAETEDEEEMGEADALEDDAAVASVKEELVLEGEDHG